MPFFKAGDLVEVTMPGLASAGPYIPATVLRPPHKNPKTLVSVEYVTALTDFVDPVNVRPAPPPEPHRRLRAGDKVDAFLTGSWVCCEISEVLENSRYSVVLVSDPGEAPGDLVVCGLSNLRLHRVWNRVDESWDPPPLVVQDQAAESCVSSSGKTKTPRLKFVFRRNPTSFEFGSVVEVTSEQKGFKESWYTGQIIGSIGKEMFLIEYHNLVLDDSVPLPQPLRELAERRHVRPKPPQFVPSSVPQFKKLQRVDAWYNDGWWSGVVSKVEAGGQYFVYFRPTCDELLFTHSGLRPHRDWVNGKWTSDDDCKEASSTLVMNSRSEYNKPSFFTGMNIEVRSDEKGYRGSWYEAKIFKSICDNERVIIQYCTLKSEDETEYLKEEAKSSDLRPRPPDIQRIYGYLVSENVDCWYNDGWWVGVVLKVLAGMKYVVYFPDTKDDLEFDHCHVRPHLEWVDGKWVYSHAL